MSPISVSVFISTSTYSVQLTSSFLQTHCVINWARVVGVFSSFAIFTFKFRQFFRHFFAKLDYQIATFYSKSQLFRKTWHTKLDKNLIQGDSQFSRTPWYLYQTRSVLTGLYDCQEDNDFYLRPITIEFNLYQPIKFHPLRVLRDG